MAGFKEQVVQLTEKYNALNERERLSILALIVIAIAIVFLELLISPITTKSDLVSNQLQNTRNQVAKLQNQIVVLQAEKQRDPDLQKKQKLQLINEQISNINSRLKEKMHGLIEPTQMAKVLEVVLTRNTDLKLERIQSLGAKPLSPVSVAEGQEPESLGIYRHGMEIEFKGSYLSTLEYLKELQKLKWKFYWDILSLDVNRYPESRIVIRVHTLSFREGWIGV